MSTTVSDSHQVVFLVTQNSQSSILSFIYLYFSDLNIFVVGTYNNDSVTHASSSNTENVPCAKV